MVYLLASKFSSFNFYAFWVNPNIKFMAKETWKNTIPLQKKNS